MKNANNPSTRTSHPKGIPDAATSQEEGVLNEERLVREGDETRRTEGGHVQEAGAAYSEHRDGGTRLSRPDGRSGINEEKPNRRNDTGEMADPR